MTARLTPGKWKWQFTTIITGQAFSLIGSGLVQFSIIWWLARETDSAVILSVSTIMSLVPIILLSPVAGVVVDRYNRRLVMMLADAFVALVTLLMAILFMAGKLEIWLIYLLLVLRASGSAFHQPAFEAAIPMIVPEQQLVRTAAMTQMLRSGINFIAPLTGALLVEWVPLPNILLFDVITAGIAVISLSMIAIPDLKTQIAATSSIKGYFADFMSGLRYVYRWKGLMALIIVFGLANFLLAPMLSMMPLIIARHFQGGAREYGLFEMALASGVIVGSLTLSIWGGFKRKIVSVNVAQILCGLILSFIAIVPENKFYLVLLATLLTGVTSSYINSPVTAIFQSKVEKAMQGRVMSIVTMVCMISMPLSLAIAGPLSDVIGLMPLVYIPGLISTVVGIACFLIPPLMHIEDHEVADDQDLIAGDGGVSPSMQTANITATDKEFLS